MVEHGEEIGRPQGIGNVPECRFMAWAAEQ
jgi:hypothetical protein